MLRGALVTGTILGALGAIFLLVPKGGIEAQAARPILWGYLLIPAATLAPRLSPTVRAILFLTSLVVMGSGALLNFGFVPFPAGCFTLAVIVGGLLFGIRTGVTLLALTTVIVVGIGWVMSEGRVPPAPASLRDVTKFENWARALFGYMVPVGALAAAVAYVVRAIEHSLAQTSTTLDELQREQERRAQAQNDLQQTRRELEESRKMDAIARLTGGVAHDFNNALFIILGSLDELRDPESSETERVEALDSIAVAANGAAQLTRQLMVLGRRDVKRPMPLRLDDLLEDYVATLRRVLADDIKIETQLSSCPPILADRAQIESMILNLVLNARDAMPEGGRLEIGAAYVASFDAGELSGCAGVELTVRDDGVGMDPQTRAHVFEPFFTTKGERGTGLGLSTTHSVVRQAGGEISVESMPGVGTTFRLRFPSASEGVPTEDGTGSKARPLRVRRTILVAEDDERVRSLIVRTLERAGNRVVAAEDGTRALERARRMRESIDLLCTDGVMPGISTGSLIEGVLEQHPKARILVCSGHVEEELVRRKVSVGAYTILPKPFNAEQLLTSIDRLYEPDSL